MRTQILPATDSQTFAHAVRLLRAGKVIAFPTDTVYGVGANGLSEPAIEQLFIVKDRPQNKAIPYLLAKADDMRMVAREIPPAAKMLAEKFWPGALTLVIPANERVPRVLIAAGETIAVRVPNHRLTRTLIEELRAPLAATSANISGGSNPANAQDVFAQLNGRLPLILDGGATPGNIASTVVDVTTNPPTIRRVGVIGVEEIQKVIGRLVT